MALSTSTYGYIIDPMFSFVGSDGAPIAGGYLKIFQAGTTTAVLTHNDWDDDESYNAENIPLDINGRTNGFVIGLKGSAYKVMICDQDHDENDPIRTIDKVIAGGANVTCSGDLIQGLNSVLSLSDLIEVSVTDNTLTLSDKELQVVTTPEDDDYIVMDGENGTRKITAPNLVGNSLADAAASFGTATASELTSTNKLLLKVGDEMKSLPGDAVAKAEDVEELQAENEKFTEKTLVSQGSRTYYHSAYNGYLNASGTYVETGAAEQTCTEFVAVEEGQYIRYDGKGFAANSFHLVWGYSDNSGSDAVAILKDVSTSYHAFAVIPSGVKYIRAWSQNVAVSLAVIGTSEIATADQHKQNIVVDGGAGAGTIPLSRFVPSVDDEKPYVLYKGEKYALENVDKAMKPALVTYTGNMLGYLKIDGSFAATASSTDNHCTDYIAVEEGQRIEYTGKGFGSSSSFAYICGYSDNSGTLAKVIQADTSTSTITKVYTIPSGVSYIRACSMNKQALTLKVGQNKTEIVVDINGTGDYTDLYEALKFVFDTEEHPVTIRVLAGTYDMPKVLYSNGTTLTSDRYLAIIGENKTNTIIRNTYGYYSTSWPNYDCACLRLAGNIYIANLTFISSDENFEGDEQYNTAYCLHLDFNCANGGICEVNNCRLVNTHGGSAIGFGTRNNYEIKIVDCDIECEQTTGHGCIYGHNGSETTPTGQKLTLIRNRIKGIDEKAISCEYAYSNNAVMNIKAIGNAVFSADQSKAFAKAASFSLDSESCLNNLSSMNA